jgi:hypothetical protein
VPRELHAAVLADHAERQAGLTAELHLWVPRDGLLGVGLGGLQAREQLQVALSGVAAEAVEEDLAVAL